MSMPFRLAMRAEGQWWVAYLARPNTMDGAKELGRVLMGIVSGDGSEGRKAAFMDLMKSALTDASAAIGGVVEHWDEPTPAPEHERSGSA